jgi:hypothetical protein
VLWFAEAPHRIYRAKIANSNTTISIPFSLNGERFYKGTGTI